MTKKKEQAPKVELKEFFFPVEGVTIKAESREEALKILKGE